MVQPHQSGCKHQKHVHANLLCLLALVLSALHVMLVLLAVFVLLQC
jgi:hypothetical protein